MKYSVNTESAKTENNSSKRISETGKYIGKFTRAEPVVSSNKGTHGIEFTFESDAGQRADYLTIWVQSADGKELFGMNFLNAMMVCLRVKEIEPTKAMFEKWDKDLGKMVEKNIEVFLPLMNKPIGLLLQKEFYTKNDMTEGDKVAIHSIFDPKTGFTSSEILNKETKASRIDLIMRTLSDKPNPDSKSYKKPESRPATSQAPADDKFDDDIPW